MAAGRGLPRQPGRPAGAGGHQLAPAVVVGQDLDQGAGDGSHVGGVDLEGGPPALGTGLDTTGVLTDMASKGGRPNPSCRGT